MGTTPSSIAILLHAGMCWESEYQTDLLCSITSSNLYILIYKIYASYLWCSKGLCEAIEANTTAQPCKQSQAVQLDQRYLNGMECKHWLHWYLPWCSLAVQALNNTQQGALYWSKALACIPTQPTDAECRARDHCNFKMQSIQLAEQQAIEFANDPSLFATKGLNSPWDRAMALRPGIYRPYGTIPMRTRVSGYRTSLLTCRCTIFGQIWILIYANQVFICFYSLVWRL